MCVCGECVCVVCVCVCVVCVCVCVVCARARHASLCMYSSLDLCLDLCICLCISIPTCLRAQTDPYLHAHPPLRLRFAWPHSACPR